MGKNIAKIKIAIICGGPSLERGISLNSARSAMDHLEADNIEIIPIYFDTKKRPYHISRAQFYSNTPSDFDFKLQETATPLTEQTLVKLLKTADIVFPIMHGPFGEDGGIQSFLEKYNLPFVGSGLAACKKAFDKFKANKFIKERGFFTLPSIVLKIYHQDHRQILEKFFKDNQLKRAIVKPATGGSSIGVFSVTSVDEALEKVELLFSKRLDTRVVVEPFAEGVEFTMIILENHFGLPVALPPTEIETDYTKNKFFDFRKKYLPTRQVTWHCPPRFNDEIIAKIQAQGEQLFALFGLRDFARFDGWVLPGGQIWFCDFNPISGMEQNSFLFQQASRIGLTHSNVLRYILKRSSERQGIKFPLNLKKPPTGRAPVKILMGGDNSERQVSLMSGTNVWLKLRRSKKYQPEPYFWDINGNIWRLPYHLCLNHTVEDIAANCQNYQKDKARLLEFEKVTRFRLGLLNPKDETDFFEPQKMTLAEFIKNSKFVFIALHGGRGENGEIQKMLRERGAKFNGPDEKVSHLCMDKNATAEFIKNLDLPGIESIAGQSLATKELLPLTPDEVQSLWQDLKKKLRAKTLIVKPQADGCSSGIVHLYSDEDLKTYLELTSVRIPAIPKATFKGQIDIIEMPVKKPDHLLFEKFIETDILRVRANKLKHQRQTGWLEITAGVVDFGQGIKALNPSITVVEGEVLSVEEKFQGGTGVNITPPPESIITPKVLSHAKKLIEQTAKALGITGYSRIDAFINVRSGNLLIIEANTLPGLTPSTVFYHQALAEKPPIFPRELLETLIQNKGY